MKTRMPKVIYVESDGTRHEIDVPSGHSVMEGAKTNDVPGIDADCGGACACATCHVYIPGEWQARVGAASSDEREMLDCATDPRENSRLSCQIEVRDELDGLVVQLPPTQR